MDKPIASVNIAAEMRDFIERLFIEYQSRKDIVVTIIDSHKYDTESIILDSVVFKHYEKLFQESKVAYDQAIEEINNTIVPEEYRNELYRFVVVFDEMKVDIYKNV